MVAQQVKVLAYRVYEPRSVLRAQWWRKRTDSQKFSDFHICAMAFVFPHSIRSKLKQPSEDEVAQQVGLGRVWSLAWSAVQDQLCGSLLQWLVFLWVLPLLHPLL